MELRLVIAYSLIALLGLAAGGLAYRYYRLRQREIRRWRGQSD